MYDGWDVGQLVLSTERGKWPYASRFVMGVDDKIKISGQVYWPIIQEPTGPPLRLPPEGSRHFAFKRLVEFFYFDEEKKAAVRKVCTTLRQIDNLRDADPSHTDLAGLEEQLRLEVDNVDKNHGGY